MTEEDQKLDGTEESTSDETRDSEETSNDLESLFADSTDDAEAPVSRKEYEDLKKGAQKLATELGRLKKDKVEPKETPVTGNSVMKNLYFKANPEAQEIWDMVEEDAKALGKDPFELYETRQGYKLEAKARAEVKAEEEKNKTKIAKPSTQTGSSQEDISKVKPEDVEKLAPAQKVAWIKEQANRERNRID
jgi:hypothetical protein